MTPDQQTTLSERPRWRWSKPLAAGLAVALSLGAASTIRPDADLKPTVMFAIAADDSAPSNPVKRPSNPVAQPDLSPELLYDLSPDRAERSSPTRAEAANSLLAAPPASAVARNLPPTTQPALRGIYTGAAKGRIVWLEVTAYCPCPKCCGPGAMGITASGKPVTYNGGAFCAADPAEFDFGAKLRIPGYHDGQPVEVIDRGGAIRHAKLDVYFPTHEEAEQWGRQWLAVTVEQR